jgi:hypothetical protein
MNRKMLWLNLALVGLVALLAWQLRLRRQEAAAGERAVLLKRGRDQVVLAPPPAAPVRPVAPAEYIDAVQNMLFSKDRNPNVIVEVPKPPPPPPPPPPMPALPYYYGQIHFGGPPVIELKTPAGKDQKGYEAGQKIGDFTVVAFDRDTVTFEWNGQQIVRDLADLKPKDSDPKQQAPAPPAASVAPPSSGVIAIGGASDAAPAAPDVVGMETGGGVYACKPGDNSPSGTIVNGYQKTIAPGLMGNSCLWSKVK